jgi:hypothetical protein
MDLDDHAARFRFLVRDRAGRTVQASFDAIPPRCPRTNGFISVRTVDHHVSAISQELAVTTRQQAAELAVNPP